jgi:hypothetical protein
MSAVKKGSTFKKWFYHKIENQIIAVLQFFLLQLLKNSYIAEGNHPRCNEGWHGKKL